MELKDLHKGDEAFMCIRHNSNAERRVQGKEGTDPEKFVVPCTVTTVGRKYITVLPLDSVCERKFYKDGAIEGLEVTNCTADYILFATRQEALDEIRKRYLVRELGKLRLNSLDLETLELLYAASHKK